MIQFLANVLVLLYFISLRIFWLFVKVRWRGLKTAIFAFGDLVRLLTLTYPPLDYGTAFAATPQKANQPTRLQLLPHLTKGLRASGGQPGLT